MQFTNTDGATAEELPSRQSIHVLTKLAYPEDEKNTVRKEIIELIANLREDNIRFD